MSFPDRHTVEKLLTILLFAVVLAIVYVARAIIVIFAFSILFAYLIDPVVRFLQRHSLFFKNLRGPHVVEAYLALLIFIVFAAHALAPTLPDGVGRFLREVPTWTDRLSTGEVAFEVGNRYGWDYEQSLRVKSFLEEHRSHIQNFLGASGRFATTAIGALVVIPILAIFFLSDGENLANQVIHIVSTQDNYGAIRSLANDLNMMLRHYIRAKVILGGLSFTYVSLATLVLGFPHALALGLWAGILEFIPIAGWITAAAAIITFGVLSHCQWIWMAALLGVWRMLIDYYIAPRVFGHELVQKKMKSVWNMTCMFLLDAFGPCAQGPDGIVSVEYMCVWRTSNAG